MLKYIVLIAIISPNNDLRNSTFSRVVFFKSENISSICLCLTRIDLYVHLEIHQSFSNLAQLKRKNYFNQKMIQMAQEPTMIPQLGIDVEQKGTLHGRKGTAKILLDTAKDILSKVGNLNRCCHVLICETALRLVHVVKHNHFITISVTRLHLRKLAFFFFFLSEK